MPWGIPSRSSVAVSVSVCARLFLVPALFGTLRERIGRCAVNRVKDQEQRDCPLRARSAAVPKPPQAVGPGGAEKARAQCPRLQSRRPPAGGTG